MFRYSTRQILLHWAVVLLLAFQYLWNEPISTAFRAFMREGQKALGAGGLAHLLVGVIVLLLALWRLSLRRSAPQAPHGSGILDKVAVLVHLALYGLLVAIPIAGLVAWFGGSRDAGEVHEVMTNLLLALAGLHVAAALFHQFVLRDGLLGRMTPRG